MKSVYIYAYFIIICFGAMRNMHNKLSEMNIKSSVFNGSIISHIHYWELFLYCFFITGKKNYVCYCNSICYLQN